MIVGITISCGLFVFSHCVKVSASLANVHVGGLAVGAFDLVNCALSVVRFISVGKCINVVVGLWATQML